jgi:hypothetical protein
VFRRSAARVLTGPAAFLVAGLLDVAAFALAVAREALARRLRGGR